MNRLGLFIVVLFCWIPQPAIAGSCLTVFDGRIESIRDFVNQRVTAPYAPGYRTLLEGFRKLKTKFPNLKFVDFVDSVDRFIWTRLLKTNNQRPSDAELEQMTFAAIAKIQQLESMELGL